MATTQLQFTIYLSDPDLVQQYKTQFNGAIIRGPEPAAAEFGATVLANSVPAVPPCIKSQWFDNPDFPKDRAYFTLSKGFFNTLFGRSKKYVWVGTFEYMAAADQPVGPSSDPPEQLSRVAFIDGFEGPGISTSQGSGEFQDSSTASPNSGNSTAASRHVDGMGFAVRGTTGVVIAHTWGDGGASPTGNAWERFYLRLKKAPTLDTAIWRQELGTVSFSNHGIGCYMNSSGALVFHTFDDVTGLGSDLTEVCGTTQPLPLNEWVRVDVITSNFSDGASGSRRWRVGGMVKFNGVEQINFADVLIAAISNSDYPKNEGPDQSKFALGSFNTGLNGIELDIDDWHGCVIPGNTVANDGTWTEPNGIDYRQGTRQVRLTAKAFDATHSVDWAGDFRGLAQRGLANGTDAITSSTSGALAAVVMDAEKAMLIPGALGYTAIVLGACFRRATSGDPQLGYDLNDAGPDDAAVTGSTTDIWRNRLIATEDPSEPGYSGMGTTPEELESLIVRFTKAADTNATQVKALIAVVQMVGTFYKEDMDPDQAPLEGEDALTGPRRGNLHNSPYPQSPWATQLDVPPDAPVFVVGGTYVGNDLGQDIISKVPVHFAWIRQIGVAGGGVSWWASKIGSKYALQGELKLGIAQARIDPEYTPADPTVDPPTRAVLQVATSDDAVNNNGTTYQYILFGDPGARFLLCDAERMAPSAVSKTVELVDENFTPQFGLFDVESYSDVAVQHYGKGTGHAAPNGSRLDAAEGSTVATFAEGGVDLLTTLAPATVMPQVAMALWRMSDGIDYDAFEAEEAIPVQIFNYTGDGAASRSMQFPRVTGRRPLFAIVIPHNGAAYVRDPSHTTNTSSLATLPNATVTTGITAGAIDGMTVGSTLNGSGVEHSVFVIMGLSTAGNGGWSANGEVYYEELPPTGSQFGDGFTQSEIDEEETGGGGDGDGDIDDFDDGPGLGDDLADPLCVPYVLRAVNLALARLGISDLFTSAADISNQATREAVMVATFYEHALRATLRDFPWNHATRYARLELVDGSEEDPVNGDWKYKFRMPTGYLFARRLVPGESDGRKFSETPIAFDVAEDDTGPFLFTNTVREPESDSEDVFVELEYTIRPNCGSRAAGDQLFVSTFANRLAMEIGPPLSRDAKLVERCEKNYELQRNSATTSNVRETQQEKPGEPDWITGR